MLQLHYNLLQFQFILLQLKLLRLQFLDEGIHLGQMATEIGVIRVAFLLNRHLGRRRLDWRLALLTRRGAGARVPVRLIEKLLQLFDEYVVAEGPLEVEISVNVQAGLGAVFDLDWLRVDDFADPAADILYSLLISFEYLVIFLLAILVILTDVCLELWFTTALALAVGAQPSPFMPVPVRDLVKSELHLVRELGVAKVGSALVLLHFTNKFKCYNKMRSALHFSLSLGNYYYITV